MFSSSAVKANIRGRIERKTTVEERRREKAEGGGICQLHPKAHTISEF